MVSRNNEEEEEEEKMKKEKEEGDTCHVQITMISPCTRIR
jgi:hypothetical protein